MRGIEIRPEIQAEWIPMAAAESREFRLGLRGRARHGGPELKAPVEPSVRPSKEPILTSPSQELR